MKALAGKIGLAVFFLAVINFAAFVIVNVNVLGGDAPGGKVENGRYYVANHGKFTEVSKAAWFYSAIHARSLMITHPLGFAGAVLSMWSRGAPGFRRKQAKAKDSN